MRKVLLLMMFSLAIFAKDLTMEIIKEVGSLPTISIEDSSQMFSDNLNRKIFKMLIADFKVTSHFRVDENYNREDFDSSFDVSKYKNSDLIMRYELSFDFFGNLISKVKLYDAKLSQIAFQKYIRLKM